MSDSITSAQDALEDALSGLLVDAEHAPSDLFPEGLNLGCEVIPGRTKRKYPPSYVAINGDDQDPRSQDGHVWLVSATIWVVTQTDDPGALQSSKERLGKLCLWLGTGCPARDWQNDVIRIRGIYVGKTGKVGADYTWADTIPLRCGVIVR
jgi:hypothetical protein